MSKWQRGIPNNDILQIPFVVLHLGFILYLIYISTRSLRADQVIEAIMKLYEQEDPER